MNSSINPRRGSVAIVVMVGLLVGIFLYDVATDVPTNVVIGALAGVAVIVGPALDRWSHPRGRR
ncbi:hypothetical protein ACU61A_40840 [Pseudonocardia sichuanensis]